MGKPTLDNILTIADPMLSDNFQLMITLPTALNGVVPGAEEALYLQCKTATKPGMTVEQVTYDLFGHTVEFAGRLTYGHTMSVEYVENYRGTITRTLESWIEISRAHDTQHGQFKSAYSTTAQLTIFDQTGQPSLTYAIYGIWPTETGELSFDGSSASNLSVSATFSYDYYKNIFG
jgi:hypothetical protein